MDLKRKVLPLLIFLLAGCQPFLAPQLDFESAVLEPTAPDIAPTPGIESPAIDENPQPTLSIVPELATPVSPEDISYLGTPQPTQVVYGVGNTPPDINPLTGEVVADPQILNRRPVFVKVSNFPARGSRPQAGLSYADLVFEYYIGEGMNRFLPVYYGQDTEKAWPLRSGRLVDAQLVNMYQGVLVYGNADPDKVDMVLLGELGDRAVSFDDAACPAICGIATHSETGVYVNTAEITAFTSRIGVKNIRYPLEGMLFKEKIPESSAQADQVDIFFRSWNRSEWHFDPETGKYLRWTELWDTQRDDAWDEHPIIPHVESITNQQLAFSNIVILHALYDEYAATLHDIEIWDNLENQRAYYFRDGIMVAGSWRAPKRDQPIQFINQNGVPMALKPGNTWIMIAGDTSSLNEVEEGRWQLRFENP